MNRRDLFGARRVTLGRAVLAACVPPGGGPAGPPGCLLTTQTAQGTYWLDDSLLRQVVTEGKPGVPLTLRLYVVDVAAACLPVANAAVEIWHCDASGYSGDSPGGTAPPEDGAVDEDSADDEDSFLRGVLCADDAGAVEFTTVFPGWHVGRAVHVHCKVYTGGRVDPATNTYGGGTAVHTGQFYLPDEIVTEVFQREPYRQHAGSVVTLAQDPVYTDRGAQDGLLAVTGSPATGLVGTLALGIDAT